MIPHSESLQAELANSISHGFGLLFGIVGVPLLIATATMNGNVPGIVGASIFGFAFLMMFTASTLYHGFRQPQVKRVLQIIDHISIYVLIAGTYTPFILLYLLNPAGITMLSILWGMTLLGVIYKIFFLGKYKRLSLAIYLSMGWMLLFVAKPFFESVSAATLTLVVSGGILYTLGVIFYRWESLRFHHAIWHLFVLAAALCHYVAVLLSV
ncbi:MAG: hemolysin III family protein [Bacteroidota bacterium]